MKFIILTSLLVSSAAIASVENFNELIEKAEIQSQTTHEEFLKETPANDTSLAYMRYWQRLQSVEGKRQVKFAMKLSRVPRAKSSLETSDCRGSVASDDSCDSTN